MIWDDRWPRVRFWTKVDTRAREQEAEEPGDSVHVDIDCFGDLKFS